MVLEHWMVKVLIQTQTLGNLWHKETHRGKLLKACCNTVYSVTHIIYMYVGLKKKNHQQWKEDFAQIYITCWCKLKFVWRGSGFDTSAHRFLSLAENLIWKLLKWEVWAAPPQKTPHFQIQAIVKSAKEQCEKQRKESENCLLIIAIKFSLCATFKYNLKNKKFWIRSLTTWPDAGAQSILSPSTRISSKIQTFPQ